MVEVFTEKTLNHPMAEVALTNPQPGGIGRVVLTPEEPMLKPFEGKGVAGQWVFEMLKLSNQVNFNTITDIQLVIEYTALADSSAGNGHYCFSCLLYRRSNLEA